MYRIRRRRKCVQRSVRWDVGSCRILAVVHRECGLVTAIELAYRRNLADVTKAPAMLSTPAHEYCTANQPLGSGAIKGRSARLQRTFIGTGNHTIPFGRLQHGRWFDRRSRFAHGPSMGRRGGRGPVPCNVANGGGSTSRSVVRQDPGRVFYANRT